MKIPESLINNFITSEFEYKTTNSNELRINSFYVKDGKYKLYISEKTGQFMDFKSGESGGFLKLVKDYCDLPTNNAAIDYLFQNYNVNYGEEKKEEVINTNEAIKNFFTNDKPVFFDNPENLGAFGKIAYKYVLDRKLDESYYSKLGYVFNDNSRYNKRLIIPFYEDGKMVYFISRAIDKNEKLRYLNLEKVDGKKFLFNIDKINEDVVICEGTMDAMSLVEDQPATCLLSADIGIEQLNKLFGKKPNSIIYVPDQDKTGLAKMDSNIKKILTYCPYEGLDVKIFTLPDGCKDLNEMKIKTGKNYILKSECSNYNSLFQRSLF